MESLWNGCTTDFVASNIRQLGLTIKGPTINRQVSRTRRCAAIVTGITCTTNGMAREVLTVRDVDEDLWKKFRAKTEEEGLRTGQALSEALGIWIEQKERRREWPDASRFLKVAGIIRPGRAVNWSEEIDDLLYGEG